MSLSVSLRNIMKLKYFYFGITWLQRKSRGIMIYASLSKFGMDTIQSRHIRGPRSGAHCFVCYLLFCVPKLLFFCYFDNKSQSFLVILLEGTLFRVLLFCYFEKTRCFSVGCCYFKKKKLCMFFVLLFVYVEKQKEKHNSLFELKLFLSSQRREQATKKTSKFNL